MKTILNPAMFCALLLAAGNAVAEVPESTDNEALLALLERRLARESTPACVALGTVSATTRMVFACSKGAGPKVPDRDSIFEIGSLSKVFTGLLLADMARRGEIAVSDPAAKHSPPGARLPRAGEREIRLVDLITHRSGLPRLPPGYRPLDISNPYAGLTPAALYEALARTTIPGESGERQSYSNFGYLWLSDIVTRVAAKPYEEVLRERILEPLGMKSTGVRLDAALRERLLPGHAGAYTVVRHWNFDPALAGVGGIRSSLADMMKFAVAASGREASPLRDSLAVAFTPLMSRPKATSTAFAWGMRNREKTGILAFHTGRTAGFHAVLVVNPVRQTAAVLLADAPIDMDDLAFHLVDPELPLK